MFYGTARRRKEFNSGKVVAQASRLGVSKKAVRREK
jgi:hypothetical protein